MPTRKNGRGTPSATLTRLLALERGQRELIDVTTSMDARIGSLEAEMHRMRTEMNDGLGAIVASIEKLHGAIERVAELSGRLTQIEQRVATLESRAT